MWAVNIQFAAAGWNHNESAITQCIARLATNSDAHKASRCTLMPYALGCRRCAPEIVIFRANQAKHSASERDLCAAGVVVVSSFLALRAQQKQFPRRLMPYGNRVWSKPPCGGFKARAQEMEPTASLSRSLCVFFPLVCLRILLSTKEESASPSSYLSTNLSSLATAKKKQPVAPGAAERALGREICVVILRSDFCGNFSSSTVRGEQKAEICGRGDVLRNFTVVAVCKYCVSRKKKEERAVVLLVRKSFSRVCRSQEECF